MKLEEKRTSVGSGRHKSEIRLKLERTNLMDLLKDNTLNQIAEMFKASIYMVQVVITEQIKDTNKYYFNHNEISTEEQLLKNKKTEGAWMNSAERDLSQLIKTKL